MIEESIGSCDGTVMGSFDGTNDEGSALGISPGYTEVEALGSKEGMVPGTGEVIGYIPVAAENVNVGIDDRAELGSLKVSNVVIPKGELLGVPIEEPSCGA